MTSMHAKYVGCRVKVVGPGHYKGKCDGQLGTIRTCYGQNMAVALDFMSNTNSTHGYFYFEISELEIIKNEKTASAADKGENKMEKMSNYLNVAVIHFLNSRTDFETYEYANYEPDLAVGDLCVVASAHHGMGLAEVVEIKDSTEEDLFREIVKKVDTSGYNRRVAQRKKAAELKTQMRERAKQLQDLVLYQTLAKEDPAMAQLLREYQALNE